jgi:predicted dehydrogenase
MEKIKVGLVGCGKICDIYFKNSKNYKIYEIAACADIIPEKAEQKAKEYGIAKVCSVKEIVEDPEIDVVLNLTIPAAHLEISLAALNSDKHVYSEKPLGVTLEEGMKIIELAKAKGLRVGCAPDTFLGGRIQTIRKLIDEGWIGEPIAVTGFMANHGHECWHPSPEFYYKKGGGPLFDMGPYYITAMIYLLGPVKRVSGAFRASSAKRLITSQPLYGKEIDVEVPTHYAVTLEFETGAIGTMITSFDIWDSNLPRMEIYGTDGTISMLEGDPLAGPDIFGGEIHFRRKEKSDWMGFPVTNPRHPATPWELVPTLYEYNVNSRALGLADMAYAIAYNRPHRANGDMALHVLEIMCGIEMAHEKGVYYNMTSTCERPSLFPMNMKDFELDK